MASKPNKPKYQMKQIRNILLIPDGEAGLEPDPFAQDTDGVDTTFPVIKAGPYELELTKTEKGESKSTPGNDMITFVWKTIANAYDTKDEVVNKGYPIYDRIVITVTEDNTVAKISKRLSAIAQAAGVKTTVRAIMDNPDILLNKIVEAKVTIQKATDEFGASNKISAYVPAKK